MRYLKDVLSASLVAATYLVFEQWSKDGTHYASFLIEPNHRQYYDIPRTDVRPHFQIIDRQVEGYLDTLRCKRFEEVESPSRRSLCHRLRPRKFWTCLCNDRNHFLAEVTVVNKFRSGSNIRQIADGIPLKELAQRMFVDEYNELTGDTRGNLRYDIGYTAVNQTDPSIVKGMFFPKRLTKCAESRGLQKDDITFEHSLFKCGCGVMKIAEEVNRMSGNDSPYFQNKKRDSFFGGRWCQSLMMPDMKPWSVFDGLSCFGTGPTIDYRVIKTERHVDKHNSNVYGEEHCPTYTEWVWIVTSSGSKMQVRVGINLYKKQCCDDAMRRWEVNETIAASIEDDCVQRKHRSEELFRKFVPPVVRGVELADWTYDADDDKDGHYSLYVNVLNQIGDRYDRNRGILLEALLTIPLTPASDGWYHNIVSVIEAFEVGECVDDHLITKYIELAKEKRGSVSWGDFPRCQPSHRGKLTERQMFQSLQNLDRILYLAEETNITKGIVKKLSSSAKNGGVHGVGQFYAQVLINVATKIGLLKNKVHVQQITISESTATYKRLRNMGIRSKSHASELIPYLSGRLRLSPHKCENMVCEMLRRKYGKDGTKDYFVKGHVLYVIEGDNVMTVDTDGTSSNVQYTDALYNNRYMPKYRWWNTSELSFGRGPHEWDNKVLMLKKRKQ